MAKKKHVEKPQRQFTKRQLSSIKRQKRRQNFIFYGGILIIVAVIVIVLVGVYLFEIRPYHQTAIKVYDREFNTRYFMDAVEYESRYYPPEYLPQALQTIVQSTPSVIEGSELIRLGAAELGITVRDDEVKEYLKELEDLREQEYLAQLEVLKEQGELSEEEYLKAQDELREFETPINDASIDLARTDLLRDRLYDEYIPTIIPSTADQVYMMVMLLESESQANEIALELETSGDFTALAEEHSLEVYYKDEKGDLGWHTSEYLEYRLDTTVPVEFAFAAEIGTISQPLYDEDFPKGMGYWVVNILEREGEDKAHVQVILVGSMQDADMVMQKVLMGENFGELAKVFSQDEASREQGGDLGLVTKGTRTTAFDAYVFNPDFGDVGIVGPFRDDNVTTQGAYWLIKAVDKEENRPIGEEDKEYLENTAYSDWVSQLWEEAAEEIDSSYLTLDLLEWIMEKLAEG